MASTYDGRVGKIVDRVLQIANEARQDFVTEDVILQWLNECQEEIAHHSYWTKETTIDVVANQETYALATLIPDLVELQTLRWTATDYHVIPVPTYKAFVDARAAYGNTSQSNTTQYYYWLRGTTLWIAPVPSANSTAGLTAFHSYSPAELVGDASYEHGDDMPLLGTVVDLGDGTVTVPCADHNFIAGMVVELEGTANYDDVYTLPAQTLGDFNHFVITATYVAEDVGPPAVAWEHIIPGAGNVNPLWPLVFDSVPVAYCRRKLAEMDQGRRRSDSDFMRYEAMWQHELSKLLSRGTVADLRIRPYRI